MKRLIPLIALVLCAVGYAAINGSSRYACTPTLSGQCNTAYLTGDDGSASLQWQTISPVTITASQCNAGYSINIKSLYLNDPGSPDATISAKSGYTLPTGWSLSSAGVLSCTGTTAVDQLFSVKATRNGFDRLYPGDFRIQVTAAIAADTTAPTVPTGLVAVNGNGYTDVTIDASSDVYEADGDTCQGTISYDFNHSVSGVQNVAGESSLCPQYSFTNVGSLSPTPTSTQTGADWEMVAAGDADGVDDLLGYERIQSASAKSAVVKVNSITATADFAKAGLMVRESTANNSRNAYCHVLKRSSGSVYVYYRYRPTDGGTATTAANVLVSAGLPIWLRLTEPSTSALTCEYSTDGITFTALVSAHNGTIFSATKYWGLATTATTGSGGATMTANYQQLNINNRGRFTYRYSTNSSGTISVRAKDGVPNASSYSGTVASAPTGGSDTTPPTRTAQPTNPVSGDISQTSVVWNLGTGTDASGICGYIPYTKTSSGGTRTTQAQQSVNSFTQTGLTASTTYYLDTKLVDCVGNVETSFSSEVTATTAASGGNPTSAPTLGAVAQKTDRTATMTIPHSAVANAHHYVVQEADCVDGITPGSYSVLSQFQHTGLSVDRTGMAISDSKSYKVGAANADNSVVLYSTASGCKWIREPWSVHLDWHPGFYIEEQQGGFGTSSQARFTTMYNQGSWATGVVWSSIMWGQIEQGTTEPNPDTGVGYENGKAFMDWNLNLAATKNKYFMVMINDKNPGSSVATSIPDGHIPNYIKTKAAYNNPSDPAGNHGAYLFNPLASGQWKYMARLWDPAVANRYAEMLRYICQTYDSNPRFEGIEFSSFALTLTSTQISESGFSMDAYIAGVKTAAIAARRYCPHKMISIRVDWPGTYAKALAFYKWMYGYRIAGADYDIVDWPGRTGSVTPGTATQGRIWGNGARTGSPQVGSGPSPTVFGTAGLDQRQLLGYQPNLEPKNFQELRYGDQSMNEAFEIANQLKVTHFGVYFADWVATHSSWTPVATSNTWANIIVPCMTATSNLTGCTLSLRDSAVYTTYPSDYIQ